MASLNELINLSQYQSGAMGRERVGQIQRATPQEQMKQSLVLQTLAAEAQRRNEEAAIAARQRQLWDSVGTVQNTNKTKGGIAEQIVDKEEAGGRDIETVVEYNTEDNIGYEIDNARDSFRGRYEPRISASGRMTLAIPKKDNVKAYDKIKVIDKARKLMTNDYLLNGVDVKELPASEVGKNLRKYMQQVEQDDYGKVYTQTPEKAPEYNTITHNDMIQGALDEPKRFITSLGGAKDFYFGAKDKQGASAGKASGGKVMIQTPDGKRGYIPQANLQKAIQRGAKLVQ